MLHASQLLPAAPPRQHQLRAVCAAWVSGELRWPSDSPSLGRPELMRQDGRYLTVVDQCGCGADGPSRLLARRSLYA